jgi:hypothetical protein
MEKHDERKKQMGVARGEGFLFLTPPQETKG